MEDDRTAQENATGRLFGELFAAYDDEAFKRSVALFEARFKSAGFDTNYFRGKVCLDAGCGGGRYSIALARLGAAKVVGLDLSETGITDARKRAVELGADRASFKVGSVAQLPFDDGTFDCVIHSGVLQHTNDPVKVVHELARVLRKGGMVYMLVYATEGLRWPLVQILRPVAQRFGFDAIDRAVKEADMPVNRRRTYMDDLFVPYIDFYSWPCLRGLLEQAGFERIERWEKGRLDHEENLEAYISDLKGFREVFEAASRFLVSSRHPESGLANAAAGICRQVVGQAEMIAGLFRVKTLSEADARTLAIGQGHHRLIAWKR